MCYTVHMMSLGLCSTSDVITFDHNCHHLHLTSAGGSDLLNNTQIKEFGSIEPDICMKMFRNLSEKNKGQFPATTCGYSMAKNACLDDAFLEAFQQEASPVEAQSLQQKDKKGRNRKGKKKFKKMKILNK